MKRVYFLVSLLCLSIMGAALVIIDRPEAASAGQTTQITVYKTPYCGCCKNWVKHLEANRFSVRSVDVDDLSAVKAKYEIPAKLHSCHTGIVGKYVFEGHVPAKDIHKFLKQKPSAKGLSVPGMPVGSPGMENGDEREPYQVISFGEKGESVFARY